MALRVLQLIVFCMTREKAHAADSEGKIRGRRRDTAPTAISPRSNHRFKILRLEASLRFPKSICRNPIHPRILGLAATPQLLTFALLSSIFHTAFQIRSTAGRR
jgi:hypothetical protein